MRKIQVRAGHDGYNAQLDRTRRFLERVEGKHENDVAFQDIIWSFFQHCWHLEDWVKNDDSVHQTQKDAVRKAVDASRDLQICRSLCIHTKHLRARRGARHSHVDIDITPGQSTVMDCFIDDGEGNLISGKELARRCVGEWERILQAHGLTIDRLS